VILGCSFDPVEEQKAFADKYRFPFSLLADTDRSIGLAYGACDAKTDGNARRIAYLIGPDGAIEEAHPTIDVRGYPGEQLKRVIERR